MEENTILQELERRATDKGVTSIEWCLCSLAVRIVRESLEHHKRIIQVLPEFDLHDGVHLKAVEHNICALMGEKMLRSLSSCELFILLCSVYLHDCGMAPAEWELKLMRLTEGTDKFRIEPDSICNDLKSPFSFEQAESFIMQHAADIYRSYKGDVHDWIFTNKSEKKFIEQLASLLVAYQDFRNGYREKLLDCSTEQEFKDLSNNIRLDFIRSNHPRKASEYVRNLKDWFLSVLLVPWAEKLCYDIADVCLAHGQDMDFVRGLDVGVVYGGQEKCNLQFLAMLLRLGDLIHFSSERAPLVLRNAKLFESSYSYSQWKIKADGLICNVEQGKISFSAFCQDADTYYQLLNYCDWVDEEIDNFYKMQRKWEFRYNLEIEAVNRTGINANLDKFIPVPGKMFSLQQNRILDLLMGVKLYKDPFSCIRELYQNALDACRCRNSIMIQEESSFSPNIEFGLGEDDGCRYLYCRDNGVGMTRQIIEDYLLKIGNSYYKSSEFYQLQSNWKSSFDPVSQFGIGILSCFMIGDRIEILTKSYQSRELISCCINGPYEYMYYRTPDKVSGDLFSVSGTLVKVFLKAEYQGGVNDTAFGRYGLMMLYEDRDCYRNVLKSCAADYKTWEKNLFRYVSEFVINEMAGVTVTVKDENGKKLKIFPKPFILIEDELFLKDEDNKVMTALMCDFVSHKLTFHLSEFKENQVTYKIDCSDSDLEYSGFLVLPISQMCSTEEFFKMVNCMTMRPMGIAVDGILVSDDFPNIHNAFFMELFRNGSLNYTGMSKPKLSLDRNQILEYPTSIKAVYHRLALKFQERVLEIVHDHIIQYKLADYAGMPERIWSYIFSNVIRHHAIFINNFSTSEHCQFTWSPLNRILKKEMSFCDFMICNDFTIIDYDHSVLEDLTQTAVFAKLFTADSIQIKDGRDVIVNCLNSAAFYPESDQTISVLDYFVTVDDDMDIFTQYDLVSNLYPIIPERLGNYLRREFTDLDEEDDDFMERESVDVGAAHVIAVDPSRDTFLDLFNQDSRSIHPELGLYVKEPFIEPDQRVVSVFNRNVSRMEMYNSYGHEEDRTHVVLLAFVHPSKLNENDMKYISENQMDDRYLTGIQKGWTILVTGMDIDNVVVLPGKHTRKEMVALLSREFWRTYSDFDFVFLDGASMRDIFAH